MMLITGKNCPKCAIVKSKISKEFTNIVDVESVDAMVTLSMLDLADKPLSLPILIIDEDGENIDPDYIAGNVEKIVKKINEGF